MQKATLDGSFGAMGVKENKELVLRLFKTGYPGNPDDLGRFFSSGYVDHTLWNDFEGLKKGLTAFKQAYPDVRWKVEDLIAEGDRVVVRSTVKVMGPTGVKKSLSFVTIFKIATGKVVETWGHGDSLFY